MHVPPFRHGLQLQNACPVVEMGVVVVVCVGLVVLVAFCVGLVAFVVVCVWFVALIGVSVVGFVGGGGGVFFSALCLSLLCFSALCFPGFSLLFFFLGPGA